MSALTDQWLLVHAASVAAQNTATALASAEDGSDPSQRAAAVAAFQAIQTTQAATLDTELKALIALWTT